MLLFDISWYYWPKKSLKLLAFSKYLVTNFSLTGELKGLLPLTKVLSIDK